MTRRLTTMLCVALAAASLVALRVAFTHAQTRNDSERSQASRLVISPRQQHLRDYPCSDCHANIEEAQLKGLPATHRTEKFDHFEGAKKCDTCHNAADKDLLWLAKGEPVSFDDSPRVCAQCHSEKYRDWDFGAHGKHVGSWNAERTRYSCADCHDPHRPGQQPMQTVAPPPFPAMGIRKGEH